MNPSRDRFLIPVCVLLVLGVFCPASAQVYTYSATASGNWSANAWAGTAPSAGGGSGYQLVFNSNTTNNLTFTDDFGTGTFLLNSLTVGGNMGFTLASSGATPDVLTFVANGGVNPTLTNKTGNYPVTISSAVLVTDALTINGTGTNALVFSGPITNNGGITIDEAGAGRVSFLTGGGTFVNNGGITVAATNAGTVILGGNSAGTAATFSGSGGITINGGSNLTMYNYDTYSFAGDVVLNGGTLTAWLNAPTALGTGTLRLHGGTLAMTGGSSDYILNAIDLSGTVTLQYASSNSNGFGNQGAVTLSGDTVLNDSLSFKFASGTGNTVDLQGHSLTVNMNGPTTGTIPIATFASIVDSGTAGSLVIASTGTGTASFGDILDKGGITI
ncbi:MAG TPA: hypothetical protein VIM58_02485, partial [Candidatus Methylacidiphilales bacterium]